MVFGEHYSSLYDRFYRDKDYAAECDLLEAAWQRIGLEPRTVLDGGCGTGGHALELVRRGYSVTGVDRSPHMLEQARAKAGAAGSNLELVLADLTELDLGSRFDAAVLMFAVLGYLTETREILRALSAVRAHLVAGGVLVFDCWYLSLIHI